MFGSISQKIMTIFFFDCIIMLIFGQPEVAKEEILICQKKKKQ